VAPARTDAVRVMALPAAMDEEESVSAVVVACGVAHAGGTMHIAAVANKARIRRMGAGGQEGRSLSAAPMAFEREERNTGGKVQSAGHVSSKIGEGC